MDRESILWMYGAAVDERRRPKRAGRLQSFVKVYLVLMCLRRLQENLDFGSQSEREVGGWVKAGFEDR